MEVTWEVVIAILGAITAFLSFLYAMLKKNPPPVPQTSWKSEIERENQLIKEQLISIKEEVNHIKINVAASDEKTLKTLERFENKIEKFTDLVIDYIRKS